MENKTFIFCDKNGMLSCIRLGDLTAEQLDDFISRFTEYADKCISKNGKEKRYGK